MPISHPSFAIPCAHYAMIYIDHEGNLKVQESRSVQERGPSMFTPEVQQNFLQILGESVACRQSIQAKDRPLKCPTSNGSMMSPSDRHSAEHDSNNMVFKIGDTQKIMAYYERAFSEFQQLNCRALAKAFICAIEPHKQSRHPYNGTAPRGSAPGIERNPEATKPQWWPPGVSHKEPDHMRKKDRVQLLVHILRRLGSYGFTADKLAKVAEATRLKFQGGSRAEIIFDILWVRKIEEQFEGGQSDINVIVDVKNHTCVVENDKSADAYSLIEEAKHHEEGQMALEPVEQESTPLTTPTEDLPLATICSLPGSLSDRTMRSNTPTCHRGPE
ncbi:unnamed protein product [Penicillium crustosum]